LLVEITASSVFRVQRLRHDDEAVSTSEADLIELAALRGGGGYEVDAQ
jgi:hypothetical protein